MKIVMLVIAVITLFWACSGGDDGKTVCPTNAERDAGKATKATSEACGAEEICRQDGDGFYCTAKADVQDVWDCCECMKKGDRSLPGVFNDMRDCAQYFYDEKTSTNTEQNVYFSHGSWCECVYRGDRPCAFLRHKPRPPVSCD